MDGLPIRGVTWIVVLMILNALVEAMVTAFENVSEMAIERKAEAQKKMGEASVLEMYLTALPEVVKNAAEPLSRTDKIVMYGDGNSTKVVRDVMNSANQIMEGVKESTGIDISSLIAGFAGGKAALGTLDDAESKEI